MSLDRLVLPENYENKLNYLDTEIAIKIVKDSFERRLAHHLNLVRVSAPLYVRNDSGLNDNLNGVERPVAFDIKDIETEVECKMLKKAINQLPERERIIVDLRFGLSSEDGEEKTQKEVADMLGISQSYISRLEKKIMRQLRKEMVKSC